MPRDPGPEATFTGLPGGALHRSAHGLGPSARHRFRQARSRATRGPSPTAFQRSSRARLPIRPRCNRHRQSRARVEPIPPLLLHEFFAGCHQTVPPPTGSEREGRCRSDARNPSPPNMRSARLQPSRILGHSPDDLAGIECGGAHSVARVEHPASSFLERGICGSPCLCGA